MLKNVLRNLRKENNTNIKTLDEKHQIEIDKYVQYVRSNGITLYETEIFRKDLIGMYFEREIRNESFAISDAKKFCDAFIKNCSRHKLEPILYTLYSFATATLFYSVFDVLFSDARIITTISLLRDSLTLIFIILSYFVLPRFILTTNKKRISICLFIFLCIFIVLLTVSYTFFNASRLFTFPLFGRLIFHCSFFIITLALWNKYNDKLSKSF